jgi:putative membrane protein
MRFTATSGGSYFKRARTTDTPFQFQLASDTDALQFQVTISDLPAVNAALNSISTIFIATGWYLIRRGHWRAHVACMITAIVSSTLFLGCYLIYHYHVGEKSTHFSAGGLVALFYFSMLISHILLAFVILPLVVLTLVPVFGRRWDRHRRIARWTMPIWLYVSVTGVLVYLMLYKWFPPSNLALGG